MKSTRRSLARWPQGAMQRLRGGAMGCLLALAVWSPAQAAPAPTVRLAEGTLAGTTTHIDGVTLHSYKGIPYAAPPVGPLRWKPPQPVAAWHGVRRADHFGPRCMQLPLFGDMVFRSDGMSEDCLYLNVWTPAHRDGRKLPVLVYFYGGGYLAGDGSEPRYDGASLAARGIVTVTVNYRLGVFGFLALPALAAESPHHAAGNYGLLDQHAALRWVHAHIARFGGNPAHITIGGESAGSMSVSAQVTSPLSRHLIVGAIGESGALIAPLAPKPLAAAERQGEAFMRQVHATSLAALRAMPAKALLQASGARGTPPFAPDIDGWFLPQAPLKVLEAGRQAHVPMLIGSNSEEGNYRALLGKLAPTPANYRKVIEKLAGPLTPEVLKQYPGHTVAEVKRSGTALAGDTFIAHSTWRWMNLQRQTGKAPVYYYYFTRARPAKRHPAPGEKPDTGAVHSGEIEYALGNLDSNHVYAWTATDHRVSRIMEGYFAHFIKTGNPNGAGLPHWPAAAPAHGGLLRQVIGAHVHTEVDHQAPRQRLLDRYYASHDAHGG